MAIVQHPSKELGMQNHDLEKDAGSAATSPTSDSFNKLKKKRFSWRRILDWGVEENGIVPIPYDKRTDKRVLNLFTMWFTALLCLLPLATGMLGTAAYGLSFRDASLLILFFTLLTTIPPAFMGILGPKTGMRQLIQARYCFGLYAVIIPLLLNAGSITGFTVVAAIVGGQTLTAISENTISIDVGIAVTCIVGLLITFCGYRFLHGYERFGWIPVVVAIVITVGCGGEKLTKQFVPADSPPAATYLTYGCLIAGFMLPFGGTVSDFAIYITPEASRKVFSYVYAGMVIPSILLLILGAAIGGAIPNVPEWNTAYAENSVGGVLVAMLSPARGFGKFVAVILALSVVGNIGITMYSISLNIQMFLPVLTRVPRPLFSLVTTAILIPVSIAAAHHFAQSLENFLGVISYWSASFVAIMIVEYCVFRKGDAQTYDHAIWNNGKQLPWGVAAIMAGICSFGLVIPCMAEVWYTGPIAETTGDIGFEVAFVVSAVLYVPFRWLEIKIRGGRLQGSA